MIRLSFGIINIYEEPAEHIVDGPRPYGKFGCVSSRICIPRLGLMAGGVGRLGLARVYSKFRVSVAFRAEIESKKRPISCWIRKNQFVRSALFLLA